MKDKKARLDAIAEGKDPAQLKKADAKKPDAKDKKDSKKSLIFAGFVTNLFKLVKMPKGKLKKRK